jgi:aminopeptidase N
VDPYRLPRTAVPRRYDIRLEPDLTTLTFRGEETVALDVTEPVSEIVLNAVDLAIDAASLENDRGEDRRFKACFRPLGRRAARRARRGRGREPDSGED